MAVYVDDAFIPFGRMKMCHMTADTRNELVRMAGAIGVAQANIQAKNSFREHIDICASKREMAVRNGAEQVTARRMGEMNLERRRGWLKGGREAYLTGSGGPGTGVPGSVAASGGEGGV